MDKQKVSKWEVTLFNQIIEEGLPEPQKEYVFHPTRRWRIDFAFVEHKVAIEVEGGSFGALVICGTCKKPVFFTRKDGKRIPVRQAGRHNDPVSYERDVEKYNELALAGWTLIRITPKLIKEHKAIGLIRRALISEKELIFITSDTTTKPVKVITGG